MQRVRIERLIEAYGADPARWPATEREAAERLLAETTDLTAMVGEARRLDNALDGYVPAVMADAETRLGQALANLPSQRVAVVAASGWSLLSGVVPRAAMLAAASVAGIFIGLSDIHGSGRALARVDVVTLISDPELISMLED